MDWIWCEDCESKNQYVDFCREFTINDVSSDAKILICTEGEYVLYLNGEFVDCGQFDDVGKIRTYDEINVSDFLKKGINTLLIIAYHQGESSFQYSVGDAGICYELTNGSLKLSSDCKTLCSGSHTFVSGDSVAKTTSQYGYAFVYDARGEGKNKFRPSIEKKMPTLQKRPIKKCGFYPCEAKLIAQGILHRKEEKDNPGNTMQHDFLSSRIENEIFAYDKKQIIAEDNIYAIYDLGAEQSGYFFLDIDAEEGTVVDIGYGEHLDDMRVRTSVGSRCFANRYISRSGRQKFTYYIRRIACRYIQLNVIGKINRISSVGIVSSLYPVNDVLEYKGNDSLFAKIIDVSKYTLRMCMHEHYEDCPWREQALYGSDSRSQMLFGYYAFGEYEFARASLSLIAESVGDDGFIKIACPSDTTKRIPSFTHIWLLAMKEYIEYSKDTSLSEKYVDTLKKIATKRLNEICDSVAMQPVGENYWNFYEWSDTNDGFYISKNETDYIDGLYNMFFYIGMDALAYIFHVLNEDELSKQIKCELKNMKEKINDLFWNDELGVYASFIRHGSKDAYSELTQAIALYSGIGDEHFEALSEKLTSSTDLVKLTLSCLVYKYDALLSCGDRFKSYVFDVVFSNWGTMIC